MIGVKVKKTWHAAKAVGPQKWVHGGLDGSTLVSAHVLYCNPERFVGVFNVHSDPPETDNLCKVCLALVGDQLRRRAQVKELRREGKPVGLRQKLDQDVWWQTRDGVWGRISEMDPTHASRTAVFLLNRASRLGTAYLLQQGLSLPEADECGDITYMSLQREHRMLEELVFNDPEKWLVETKLYRALMKRSFDEQ